MNDTSDKIEGILRERYAAMSGAQRVKICTGMYETAKALVLASIPENLDPEEKKRILFKRMHGFDLPAKT